MTKYIYRELDGGIARECPPMRGMTFLDAKQVVADIHELQAKIEALEEQLASQNIKMFERVDDWLKKYVSATVKLSRLLALIDEIKCDCSDVTFDALGVHEIGCFKSKARNE